MYTVTVSEKVRGEKAGPCVISAARLDACCSLKHSGGGRVNLPTSCLIKYCAARRGGARKGANCRRGGNLCVTVVVRRVWCSTTTRDVVI